MNKRKRRHQAWAVEWKQVYQRDREQRLQRAFGLILPGYPLKAGQFDVGQVF
jgi:hypothetical protein